MVTPLQEFEQRVVTACARVEARLRPDIERKLSRRFAEDDPDREAKLAKAIVESQLVHTLEPLQYVQRFYRYLPYFVGLGSVFEIGVGTGIMLALLKDHLGLRVHGVDVKFGKLSVFVQLREELGLGALVEEAPVKAGVPFKIPEGTQCVTAFNTVFNRGWGVEEHEWFLDQCSQQLTGARVVVCYFNSGDFDDTPPVKEFYERRAAAPLRGNPRFVIVSL